VVTQLLDVFSFLSVLLRGAALACQTLIVGGAIFSFWILRPLKVVPGANPADIFRSTRRLICWCAVVLAVIQSFSLAADSLLLISTTGLTWHSVIGANFFIAGLASVAAAVMIIVITARDDYLQTFVMVAPVLIIIGTLVATSHAAGRVQGRAVIAAFGALHMLAVASWIGGLAYLLLTLARTSEASVRRWLCRRFSSLAALSVMVLTASGCLLSAAYIDSSEALYGTAYGAMVLSKTVMFGMLVALGGTNFLIVRRMADTGGERILTLRRFVEAELGIGFTVILAAASLSSQPPAVDLPADRLSMSEIAQRFAPVWPRFVTPPLASLSPATPLSPDRNASGPESLQSFVPGTSYQPNTPDDIAWSEYNHHWAGLIVVVIGLLAVAARLPGFRWARHWPLAFLGLAVFLLVRADPENWPLGPRSFWQSFTVAEVLQHRLFVLLIAAFAVFEWGVATARISSRRAALVFPVVCAAGGALLLTHAHSLGNVKEELLSELSHIALAMFGILAGWSRWLEVRVEGTPRQFLAWMWPACFVVIGMILLNYRES
jgi:putative copper resistance protein D